MIYQTVFYHLATFVKILQKYYLVVKFTTKNQGNHHSTKADQGSELSSISVREVDCIHQGRSQI